MRRAAGRREGEGKKLQKEEQRKWMKMIIRRRRAALGAPLCRAAVNLVTTEVILYSMYVFEFCR